MISGVFGDYLINLQFLTAFTQKNENYLCILEGNSAPLRDRKSYVLSNYVFDWVG